MLDWYLTVRDNDWCDPIANKLQLGGPAQPSSTTSAPALANERLQELAAAASGERPSVAASSGYTAARIMTNTQTNTNLPPNHKASVAQIHDEPTSGSVEAQPLDASNANTNNNNNNAPELATGTQAAAKKA